MKRYFFSVFLFFSFSLFCVADAGHSNRKLKITVPDEATKTRVEAAVGDNIGDNINVVVEVVAE